MPTTVAGVGSKEVPRGTLRDVRGVRVARLVPRLVARNAGERVPFLTLRLAAFIALDSHCYFVVYGFVRQTGIKFWSVNFSNVMVRRNF